MRAPQTTTPSTSQPATPPAGQPAESGTEEDSTEEEEENVSLDDLKVMLYKSSLTYATNDCIYEHSNVQQPGISRSGYQQHISIFEASA